MKISLAMIVRNEEKTIERTIRSVLPIVSEVVVGIDSKSSDGTRAIVESLGAKIVETRLSDELAAKVSSDDDPEWGFSKARNRVFSACDSESWRIVLDGHEVVRNATILAEEIEKAAMAGEDGVAVTISFEPGPDGIPQTMFESVRAMAPAVRYVNQQHNAPTVSRRREAHRVVIDHLKQDQNPADKKARDAQRSDATISGFEKAVLDDPKNARSWFYLGNAYRENARLEEAISAYERCLEKSRWNEERWHARTNAGRCLSSLGRIEEARRQFSKAIDEFPEMAEAYFYLGEIAYKTKNFGEARVWFERCVSMPMPKCRLFLTPRIYLVDRHDYLSMVYDHLRLFKLAIEQAEIALQSVSNARIERNRSIWSEYVAKNERLPDA